MQSQPDIASAGWGVFRFVLNVIREYQIAPGIAIEALNICVDFLDTLQSAVSSGNNETVQRALCLLLRRKLLLVHSATTVLERGKFKRMLCAVLRQTSAEIQDKIQDMKDHQLSFQSLCGWISIQTVEDLTKENMMCNILSSLAGLAAPD